MKNIYLILKDASSIPEFLSFADEAKAQGVEVLAQLSDEEVPVNEEALYITDDDKVVSRINEKKLPILGYTHGDSSIFFKNIRYVFEDARAIDFQYVKRIFQRFKYIPWDILETERCLVRESTIADVDAFYEIYKDEGITKYTDDLYEDKWQEIAYMKDYISQMYRFYEFGVWTVIHKESGEIIGRAGLSTREGYDLPELGFVIESKYQGMGIATEVCQAVIKYGREYLGFDKFQALVMEENKVSIHLLEKLGFQVQGKVWEKGVQYLLMIL